MTTAKNISQLKKSKLQFKWTKLSEPKLEIIQKNAGDHILDIGCSTGSYVKKLLELGYDAQGCDILIDENWKKIDAKRFKKADIYKLPYESKSFETITLFETLEHLEDPQAAIKEVKRVATKNIILSVPNCNFSAVFQGAGFTFWHYMDRTHVNFYTEQTLRELLTKNGFKIELLKLINPVMPETFVLHAWHIPLNISIIIGKILQRLPFSKKYYTDILLVAALKQ